MKKVFISVLCVVFLSSNWVQPMSRFEKLAMEEKLKRLEEEQKEEQKRETRHAKKFYKEVVSLRTLEIELTKLGDMLNKSGGDYDDRMAFFLGQRYDYLSYFINSFKEKLNWLITAKNEAAYLSAKQEFEESKVIVKREVDILVNSLAQEGNWDRIKKKLVGRWGIGMVDYNQFVGWIKQALFLPDKIMNMKLWDFEWPPADEDFDIRDEYSGEGFIYPSGYFGWNRWFELQKELSGFVNSLGNWGALERKRGLENFGNETSEFKGWTPKNWGIKWDLRVYQPKGRKAEVEIL